MPIDAISSATSANPPPIRNDFQNLASALKNGNLAAAQKAYDSIQDAQEDAAQNAQAKGLPQPPADSPIAKDFAALGDALSKGDLKGAQDAFTSLQSDMESMRAQRGAGGPPPGGGGPGGGGQDKSDDSGDNSQKTIASQVSTTNANGTVTVTITYTDGSTSTRTDPNPNPVASQNPINDNNGQLAVLLTAQEQAALTNQK